MKQQSWESPAAEDNREQPVEGLPGWGRKNVSVEINQQPFINKLH